MHKQLFDDAIGEVPPSTVDVEGVITRGRRADRIRRVANPVVAAGVAVVLLSGAVAYTMMRGEDGGGVRVGGSPGTSTEVPATQPSGPRETTDEGSPPTGEPPEACSRPDLESGPEVVSRLTPVVKAAFHAQRPDVQFVANPVNQYPDGVQHGPLDLFQVTGEAPRDLPICDGDSYFMARATVTMPDGVGNVLIVVQPAYTAGAILECDPPGNGGEQTYCDLVNSPEGDRILKQTRSLEGGTTMTRVDIVRADGTSVIVESSDIGTDVKTGEAPTASTTPFTHDQLVLVGTDPGMTLFP